jgi:hypothetical protein
LSRKPLIVSDFDGCLLRKGNDACDAISPGVAEQVRRIQRCAPLAIVTARASARAVDSGRRALAHAGLQALPFLHRDMQIHDHSPTGICAAKRAAICAYAQAHDLTPAIGIGDEPTDEQVYRTLGMTIIRCHWGTSDEVSLSNYVYLAMEQTLPEMWTCIAVVIEHLIAGGLV